MPCYHPLHGWRSRKMTANGKYGIVFDVKNGFRDMPLSVPCGQCIGCRLERSRQWAIRCVHEAQLHKDNCFITLTYSDEELKKTYGNYTGGSNQNPSLCLEHFQTFLKRLRKKYGKLRFFHAGEYGEQTQRPHYHACIFGFDFPDKILYSLNKGNRLFTSNSLDKIWGHGKCWIGEVTFESAAYVARYIMKKITGQSAAVYYSGRMPEYCTMSRRPGIGSGWLGKFQSDVYPRGELTIRGKKMRPPRFYDRRLELTDPAAFAKLKRVRKAEAELKKEDNTDERLKTKEEVRLAAIATLKRNLH